MTEYPDYGRLLENISVIHGDLSPKEKVIAFLAYSLGAVDVQEFMKERYRPSTKDAIDQNWRIDPT
jgi:hypothetical protein